MTTNIEYALMAGASYISTRPDVNKFPIPADRLKGSASIDFQGKRISGFEALGMTNIWIGKNLMKLTPLSYFELWSMVLVAAGSTTSTASGAPAIT